MGVREGRAWGGPAGDQARLGTQINGQSAANGGCLPVGVSGRLDPQVATGAGVHTECAVKATPCAAQAQTASHKLSLSRQKAAQLPRTAGGLTNAHGEGRRPAKQNSQGVYVLPFTACQSLQQARGNPEAGTRAASQGAVAARLALGLASSPHHSARRSRNTLAHIRHHVHRAACAH